MESGPFHHYDRARVLACVSRAATRDGLHPLGRTTGTAVQWCSDAVVQQWQRRRWLMGKEDKREAGEVEGG